MSDGGSADDYYPPISAYGLIGDCHTAALVSDAGSIDWYCPGRFDAPAVLCRLLDAGRGGFWSVCARDLPARSRSYLPGTNILKTSFSDGAARLELTDFMPVAGREPAGTGYDIGSGGEIVRLVEASGDSGIEVEVRFRPTFDYARARTTLDMRPGLVEAKSESERLTLIIPGAQFQQDEQGGVSATFRLQPGQRRWLLLISGETALTAEEAVQMRDLDGRLRATEQYWHQWSQRCTYRGTYRDQVLRSALVLKLLTYEPTGAIVAAPTTSLPEGIGGVRNWDYRYTWMRDSSLILYALLTIGYRNEAAGFFEFLKAVHKAHRDRPPQIMYTIEGKTELPEVKLDHLAGYQDSRPVRVGNEAANQHQLDIYGELLASASLYYRGAHEKRPITTDDWELLCGFVKRAAEGWQRPGHGIWEVRGETEKFLYSRIMCWVALHHGIRLAETYGLPAPLDEWRRVCAGIRKAILTKGVDPDRGVFTQAFGSKALDASALMIPQTGFLPATDPRVQSTIAAIRANLTEHSLVYRYRNGDSLPGGEGTFTPCTFWLVSALALSGKVTEANDLFEKTAARANDLGLMSEELDATNGAMRGNFPQGFTHLALIQAAVNLAKASRHGAEGQAETEEERSQRAGPAASDEKNG